MRPLLGDQLASYAAQTADLTTAVARVAQLTRQHQEAEAGLLKALEPLALAEAQRQRKISTEEGWRAVRLKPLSDCSIEVRLRYFAEDSVSPGCDVAVQLPA